MSSSCFLSNLYPALLCVDMQHHVCSVCERPFQGHPFYERGGHAYCERHFDMVRASTVGLLVTAALLPQKLQPQHEAYAHT